MEGNINSEVSVKNYAYPEGIPANAFSRALRIKGKGHVFRIKTAKGLYYKFVSDVDPTMISYIAPDDVHHIDGDFPSEAKLMETPLLEDYSPETEMITDAYRQKMLNSEAFDRFGSVGRDIARSPNANNSTKYQGLTRKSGPFSNLTKINNSNLRKHSKELGERGAGAIFNRSASKRGWFWGGKKSRKTRRRSKKRQTRRRK